jgi:hypothetical protein
VRPRSIDYSLNAFRLWRDRIPVALRLPTMVRDSPRIRPRCPAQPSVTTPRCASSPSAPNHHVRCFLWEDQVAYHGDAAQRSRRVSEGGFIRRGARRFLSEYHVDVTDVHICPLEKTYYMNIHGSQCAQPKSYEFIHSLILNW